MTQKNGCKKRKYRRHNNLIFNLNKNKKFELSFLVFLFSNVKNLLQYMTRINVYFGIKKTTVIKTTTFCVVLIIFLLRERHSMLYSTILSEDVGF